MNRILTELDQKLHECLRTYLPEISECFVRVSPEAFEPDKEGKKIYMEQRK